MPNNVSLRNLRSYLQGGKLKSYINGGGLPYGVKAPNQVNNPDAVSSLRTPFDFDSMIKGLTNEQLANPEIMRQTLGEQGFQSGDTGQADKLQNFLDTNSTFTGNRSTSSNDPRFGNKTLESLKTRRDFLNRDTNSIAKSAPRDLSSLSSLSNLSVSGAPQPVDTPQTKAVLSQPEPKSESEANAMGFPSINDYYRFIDNVSASKHIKDRERTAIPQQGLQDEISLDRLNYRPQKVEADRQRGEVGAAVGNTSLSTAQKSGLRGSNLAQTLQAKNAITGAEEQGNTQIANREALINQQIKGQNLGATFQNETLKFRAKDDIRQDKQRNTRDATEDIGETIKDSDARQIVKDQNLFQVALADPRKQEMLITSIPDDRFQRATGMSKADFAKLTAEQRAEAIQTTLDAANLTDNNYGGSLRKKMKY